MDPHHETYKTSKSSITHTISSLPKNVITEILDRLPIQEAVRTGILSRNWRFKWTFLSHLVFNDKFFEYLLRSKNGKNFNGRSLSRLLLHLNGNVTKFVLYIPKERYFRLDIEDINHWVMFLSEKEIKEFTLINMRDTPLKMPTHIFSCLKLKHLVLKNCCFHRAPNFCGFPNLLTFNFDMVTFENCKFSELITQCPLLETLRIDHNDSMASVIPFQFAKLGNLKTLTLSLCKLGIVLLTSSVMFRILDYLPKLEELALDFQNGRIMAEAGAKKRVHASLSLKKLTLSNLEFNCPTILAFSVNLIHCSPNLQNLKIRGTPRDRVWTPAVSSLEADYGLTGDPLQLQVVELECIRDSEFEICLIKYLLAYSPLLKKMVINHTSGVSENYHGYYMFAKRLLKFYRASLVAKIDLN